MIMASSPKHKSTELARRYQLELRRCLQQGATGSLRPAQKLGRQAMAEGLETLDLTLIHEQALIAQALPIRSSAARARMIRLAGAFFAKAILPLEGTHRLAVQANIRLSRLNQALSQRTLDLATSNRELKKEIAKRLVVERSLRHSEQHSIRLLNQSRRMQEQLRQLSRQILSAQEEERKRISRELHDVIAQVLTSINVRLAVLKTEAAVNTKGLSRNIARTQKMVEKSPAVLDILGLIPALHSFMKGFAKETGVHVSLTAFAGVEQLSNVKRTALYRVAQEALTNVARHAQASRVEVNIQRLGKFVRMQIKDNGRSFQVEQVLRVGKSKRMGLLSMRERAEMVGGHFSIESAAGKGTTVRVQLPFKKGGKERMGS